MIPIEIYRMHERAIYFKYKFIRNGIAGIVISALLYYNAVSKNEFKMPGLIIFPALAFIWLCFGLWINKKLKSKDAATDALPVSDKRISYKQVDFIFSLLAIAIILSIIKDWKYVHYLAIPFLAGYFLWFYSQMKILNNYFKG